jgi:hypothetical protein
VESKGEETLMAEHEVKDQRASDLWCLFHQKQGHNLHHCSEFRALRRSQKGMFAWRADICFRCLEGQHKKVNCFKNIICGVCRDKNHCSAMHSEPERARNGRQKPKKQEDIKVPEESKLSEKKNVPEQNIERSDNPPVYNSDKNTSYSKTFLVSVRAPGSSKILRMYCATDSQSSCSYIHPDVIKAFNIKSSFVNYYVRTVSSNSRSQLQGQIVEKLSIKAVGRANKCYKLSKLYGNPHLKKNICEAATPEIVKRYPDIAHLASNFQPLDTSCRVHILIGRDHPELLQADMVHKKPLIYHTNLGWAIVGKISDGTKEHGIPRTLIRQKRSREETHG